MTSPTSIVAYLALFAAVGFVFLFVNLLIGRFVRPDAPNQEKLEIYECGEPTIGSSFVQFDLRFYVVALLFIIFDVEVAFFFPWATVYGKATHLMDPNLVRSEASMTAGQLTADEANLYRELGVADPKRAIELGGSQRASDDREAVRESARGLALFSIIDIAVFFAVLLVGFAYVWKRGDLDWVRAVSREKVEAATDRPTLYQEEAALSA